MSERERLIELIGKAKYYGHETFADRFVKSYLERLADHLLQGGVIVLPCDKVYSVVDKNTKYAYIHSKRIEELSISEIRDLSHYGYYVTKEEAEKALKGGAE